MKNTMIKKINIIVSLWFIAIMVVLFIFGRQLSLVGFYYACGAVAALLLGTNIFTVTSGLTELRKSAVRAEKEYNKF